MTPDRDRDVLLISLRLEGDEALKPYVILAPRLGMTGRGNIAFVRRHGSRQVLAAENWPYGLALAAVDETMRDGFGRTSVGYVGASDGWQDFDHNGRLTWRYANAGPGNVALIGELARAAVLGLGFGDSVQAAATQAVSALMQPFANPLKAQIDDWAAWHQRRDRRMLERSDPATGLRQSLALSAMVVRTHRDKTYPGAMVASLSIPWGNSRDDRGGYHLVWPRDLVQCATALLALGAEHEARETLRYLVATQKPDGSWSQNQWLDGTPYWGLVQLDEVAFPVLLAAALAERDALDGIAVEEMSRRALGFIARTGPSSFSGPVGGERRHQRVHARGVHRRADPGARFSTEPERTCARSRRLLERERRIVDERHGDAFGQAARRRRLLRPDRAMRSTVGTLRRCTRPRRSRTRRGQPPYRRRGGRAPISCNSSAWGSARPTTDGRATVSRWWTRF